MAKSSDIACLVYAVTMLSNFLDFEITSYDSVVPIKITSTHYMKI